LINPYGYRIWWEVWMQMTDSTLRWTIAEWTPVLLTFISVSLALFNSLFVALLFVHWKKFRLEQKVISICLLIAACTSIRHMPLSILFSLSMMIQSYSWIRQQATQYTQGAKRFALLEKYFLVGISILVFLQTVWFIKDLWSDVHTQQYPVQAITFLQAHPTSGNIFSTYNWGGYLIWKLPGKKVLVDGRMPSWRWKAPNNLESDYAFAEQMKIGTGEIPLQQVIKKYTITAFLFPAEKISKQKNKPLFTIREEHISGKKKKQIDVIKEVEKNGFKKVYEDDITAVYIKP